MFDSRANYAVYMAKKWNEMEDMIKIMS